MTRVRSRRGTVVCVTMAALLVLMMVWATFTLGFLPGSALATALSLFTLLSGYAGFQMWLFNAAVGVEYRRIWRERHGDDGAVS